MPNSTISTNDTNVVKKVYKKIMNRHQEIQALSQECDDLWEKVLNNTITNEEYTREVRDIEQEMDELAGDIFEEFM